VQLLSSFRDYEIYKRLAELYDRLEETNIKLDALDADITELTKAIRQGFFGFGQVLLTELGWECRPLFVWKAGSGIPFAVEVSDSGCYVKTVTPETAVSESAGCVNVQGLPGVELCCSSAANSYVKCFWEFGLMPSLGKCAVTFTFTPVTVATSDTLECGFEHQYSTNIYTFAVAYVQNQLYPVLWSGGAWQPLSGIETACTFTQNSVVTYAFSFDLTAKNYVNAYVNTLFDVSSYSATVTTTTEAKYVNRCYVKVYHPDSVVTKFRLHEVGLWRLV